MFTGIITHIGSVERIDKSGDWVFTIAVPGFTGDAAIGASIACNGTCLTVIKKDADHFMVQVSAETRARTTLGDWQEGARVNLERALKVGDELGGHFVTGHVDGTAILEEKTYTDDSGVLTFSVPSELSRFTAVKGSVTLDGISLTVNDVDEDRFSVNIIPHTLRATTLYDRKQGDRVNLEVDLIARYLSRLRVY